MSTTDDGSPDVPDAGDRQWYDDEIPNDRSRARYARQIEIMRAALEDAPHNRERNITVGIYPENGDDRRGGNLADAEFLYRADTIITTDANADRVQRVLDLEVTDLKSHPQLADPIEGVRVLLLTNGMDAITAVQRVDEELGPRIASPDFVHHITSSSACPAIEPVPAQGDPVPPVNEWTEAGRCIKVAVVDTGFRHDVLTEHNPSWLQGVTGEEEDPNLVGHYRGHGTFVAGVVRTMAPAAQVHVHRLLTTDGADFESDLLPRLVAAWRTSPDIISMSAGVRPDGTIGSLWTSIGLLGFQMFYLRHSRTILVCAAGNDGDQGPFEPASQRWPVAVGALTAGGLLAPYSNFGPWVDTFARGSDVVNAYPDGPYVYEEEDHDPPSVDFVQGMARWSGTSFATPLVAGLVAARLSWSNETPLEAWTALSGKAVARSANPPYLPVLEPGDGNRP